MNLIHESNFGTQQNADTHRLEYWESFSVGHWLWCMNWRTQTVLALSVPLGLPPVIPATDKNDSGNLKKKTGWKSKRIQWKFEKLALLAQNEFCLLVQRIINYLGLLPIKPQSTIRNFSAVDSRFFPQVLIFLQLHINQCIDIALYKNQRKLVVMKYAWHGWWAKMSLRQLKE